MLNHQPAEWWGGPGGRRAWTACVPTPALPLVHVLLNLSGPFWFGFILFIREMGDNNDAED